MLISLKQQQQQKIGKIHMDLKSNKHKVKSNILA